MKKAILALGTNLPNREKNLLMAINSLEKIPRTKVNKVSSIYSTKPFLVPDKQDDYLNCCVEVETELFPKTLLGCCLGIEAAMGRLRPYKNAARIIDIDLLLYENENSYDEDLILPHPRIKERAFVMVPLNNLLDGHCFFDFNFSESFNDIDKSGVSLYKNTLEGE